MAKITITIEDLFGGGVTSEADPSGEEMAAMVRSGHGLTAAHGYALAAMNLLVELSRRSKENSKLLVSVAKPQLES